MSDQAIVQRADLQKKDKSELSTIVEALGGKVTSRATKASLTDQILELSGAVVGEDAVTSANDRDSTSDSDGDMNNADAVSAKDKSDDGPSAESKSNEAASDQNTSDQNKSDQNTSGQAKSEKNKSDQARSGNNGPRNQGGNQGGNQNQGRGGGRGRGRGGEPPAEWETELAGDSGASGQSQSGQNKSRNQGGGKSDNKSDGKSDNNQGGNQGGNQSNNKNGGNNQGGNQGGNNRNDQDDDDGGNRRRRRRGRGRDRDDDGPAQLDPVEVAGYLELRDDGYGFLRVDGWTQSKDDVYVPVKMVRQFGLRRGDHVTGTARPATRNEKNPAMDTVVEVNGLSGSDARNRPNFDELTPLFPEERLRLELDGEPEQYTGRVIDLIAPIGKGQRGLIVSPPNAGKTTIVRDIAKSIETNNPDTHLVVLLIDERPEEVTEMARSLENSEVIASTFDRPPEEHVALAELTIERAKRLVETGEDIVIMIDGITRLTRAYNLSGAASGRVMQGGVDSTAIHLAKRFFGAARNLEDGGSLTILATALVQTGSAMDDAILEEFASTANMELHLDRHLADQRIFPAIDVEASATRRHDLLHDEDEGVQATKLRAMLTDLADQNGGQAITPLLEQLEEFDTNEALIAKIAKS